MKDATGAEIFECSDGELEHLVKGKGEATWSTRQMAQTELDRRELERVQTRERSFHLPGRSHFSEARELLADRESS